MDMKENKIIYRKAQSCDDLDKIAYLLYKTDPYIYPFWFKNNEMEAKNYLKHLILSSGNLFSLNNLYVACLKDTKEIVGILCAIDNESVFDYSYQEDRAINNNYAFTIDNYILPVQRTISDSKLNDFAYISNVCVDDSFRGNGIGYDLVNFYLNTKQKKGYKNFALDCLLHNLPAKNLYHKLGFKEDTLITGFDGTLNSKVEVVTFVKNIKK